MATTLSRRALLRGRIAGIALPIRPPWALDEAAFVDRCSRCDDCAKACTETLIHKADGGFPVVDFHRGECTFCGDCVQVCTSGALNISAMQAGHTPWHLTPSINDNCLAHNRVVCRSCSEQCEQRAIRFRPAPGGVSRPELDPSLCNGCGACIRPCPANAIKLNSKQEISA